jgi:hypothetical protein
VYQIIDRVRVMHVGGLVAHLDIMNAVVEQGTGALSPAYMPSNILALAFPIRPHHLNLRSDHAGSIW